jgi:hypothetical protein
VLESGPHGGLKAGDVFARAGAGMGITSGDDGITDGVRPETWPTGGETSFAPRTHPVNLWDNFALLGLLCVWMWPPEGGNRLANSLRVPQRFSK